MPPGNAFIEHGKPLEIYCVVDDEFVEKNGQSASSRLTFLQASSGTVNLPLVFTLFYYFLFFRLKLLIQPQ